MKLSGVSRFRPVEKKIVEARARYQVYRTRIDIMRAFRARKPVSSNNAGLVGGVTAGGVALAVALGFAFSGAAPSSTAEAVIPPEAVRVAALEAPSSPPFERIKSDAVNTNLSLTLQKPAPGAPEKGVTEGAAMKAMPNEAAANLVETIKAPTKEPSLTDLLALLPAPRATLPPPSGDAPFTLVVDKSRRTLFVLVSHKRGYKIIDHYTAELGEERGDKQKTGDLKTPEGLYYITSIKEDKELPSRYGPRAYVLDYPNSLDKKEGKTGYGIWIHGSGLGEKIEPTEGCVEINDRQIIELGAYVDTGAPVYIFPEGFTIPIEEDEFMTIKTISPDTLYALKEWGGPMPLTKDAVVASVDR